mgnify:CR=1 FL=1
MCRCCARQTEPSLTPPGSPAVVATVGAGATTYTYKITAVGENSLDESLASSSVACTNNLLTTGNYNTVTWAAVTGAKRYRVYQESNGLFGFIGQTDGLTFEASIYRSWFSNFVYEERTGAIEDGLPVYQIRQADARMPTATQNGARCARPARQC